MHRFSSDPKKPQLRRVRPIALPALSAPNDYFMGVCQTQNRRLGGSRFCVIIEATVMVIPLIQYLPKSGFLGLLSLPLGLLLSLRLLATPQMII